MFTQPMKFVSAKTTRRAKNEAGRQRSTARGRRLELLERREVMTTLSPLATPPPAAIVTFDPGLQSVDAGNTNFSFIGSDGLATVFSSPFNQGALFANNASPAPDSAGDMSESSLDLFFGQLDPGSAEATEPRILITPMPGFFVPPPVVGEIDDTTDEDPRILITPMPGKFIPPPVIGEIDDTVGNDTTGDRTEQKGGAETESKPSEGTGKDSKNETEQTNAKSSLTPNELKELVENLPDSLEKQRITDQLREADLLDADAEKLDELANGQRDRADEFANLEGQQEAVDRLNRNADEFSEQAEQKREQAKQIRDTACADALSLREALNQSDAARQEESDPKPIDKETPVDRPGELNGLNLTSLLDKIQRAAESAEPQSTLDFVFDVLGLAGQFNDVIGAFQASSLSALTNGLSFVISVASEIKSVNNPTLVGQVATAGSIASLEVAKAFVPVLGAIAGISSAQDLGFQGIDRVFDNLFGPNNPEVNNGLGLFEIVPASLRLTVAQYEQIFQLLTGQQTDAVDQSIERAIENGGIVGFSLEFAREYGRSIETGDNEGLRNLVRNALLGNSGRGVQALFLTPGGISLARHIGAIGSAASN